MTPLSDLAEQLLATASANHSGRCSSTVYGGREHRLRQTWIALRAGRELASHLGPDEATLLVLRGRVVLHADDVASEGAPGDLMVIRGGRHSLSAVENSVVLLTVLADGPA